MSTHAFQPISEVMQTPVYAIRANTRVADVFCVSELLHVHHFPVLEGDDVVGMVCTCDLLEANPDAEVGSWMRRDVATIDPTGTTERAAALMRKLDVGSVVIADDSHLCGIVTRENLTRDPKLASALAAGHCSACGARKHLRRGPNDLYLCADCNQRARADSWYETGGGD